MKEKQETEINSDNNIEIIYKQNTNQITNDIQITYK